MVVAASLCELHSSGAACSKYNTRRLVASMIQHATFLCVVMRTFARSAHSIDTYYIHTYIHRYKLFARCNAELFAFALRRSAIIIKTQGCILLLAITLKDNRPSHSIGTQNNTTRCILCTSSSVATCTPMFG